MVLILSLQYAFNIIIFTIFSKKEVYFEAEGKLDSNSDRYKRLVKAEEVSLNYVIFSILFE